MLREQLGLRDDIVADEQHQLASRRADAAVARGSRSGVAGLAEVADIRTRLYQAIRAVGRSIVNHDDLKPPWLECLSGKRVQATLQRCDTIVGRNDDADVQLAFVPVMLDRVPRPRRSTSASSERRTKLSRPAHGGSPRRSTATVSDEAVCYSNEPMAGSGNRLAMEHAVRRADSYGSGCLARRSVRDG